MTGVPNSVSSVSTLASHFRKINQRLASLERASSSGGGGGAIDWTQGYTTYDPRYINVGGDTMTGDLSVPSMLMTTAQRPEVNSAARRDFVEGLISNNAIRTYASGTPTAQNLGATGTILSVVVPAQPVDTLANVMGLALHNVSDATTRYDILLTASPGSATGATRGVVGAVGSLPFVGRATIAAGVPTTLSMTVSRLAGTGTINIVADARFWNFVAMLIPT